MVKNIFPIITVILFSFIAGFPLLHKGFPPTHDGEYHVVRFYEFGKTLRDGNWYPRWSPDLNNSFGIPLFNFVYPLPNYIASFFHFLGLSFIDSFKLEMFLAIILGGAFFYLWTKEFWGELGGIVSSVFYTFSPYHFVDIYIRGSVGEVWALAFFPAFLWSFTKFVESKRKAFFILSSIFLSLIIFSHNILALMFFPFALSYMTVLTCKEKNKKYFILNTLYLILLSLGLSAIFWLPAIVEKQYVTGLEIFDVTAHFPQLYQLLIPSWGSGFSRGSMSDQLSFQIGVANLIVVLFTLLSLIFIFVFRHSGKRSASRISNGSERFWTSQNDNNIKILLFLLACFFIIFFLVLKISKPIWQFIPLMNYFQFPWRLLSLEILIASFLAGSIIYFWKSKVLAISLILLSFFLGIGYGKVSYYHYRDDNYYLSRSNFMDGTNSPGNVFNTIWFNTSLKKQKEKLSFLKGRGKINKEVVKSTRYIFNLKADSDSEIAVNTAYFPGWVVYIDNKKTKSTLTSDGLFSFNFPKGDDEVKIEFRDTAIRKVGMILSLLSFIVILFLFIRALFATIKK